ncbi:hypothetical protein KCP71_15390 [Salmonella enterica subsp. enterica]|nr:hypothetical protein KCP71_15390 [Salmonella enterica subsp. enterica]
MPPGVRLRIAGRAEHQRRSDAGLARSAANFIIVSDPYDGERAVCGSDHRPPCGLKKRLAAKAPNAARSSGVSRIKAPGEAEIRPLAAGAVLRRFKTRRCGGFVKAELRGKTLYDVLFATPAVSKFPAERAEEDQLNAMVPWGWAFYLRKRVDV